MPKILIADDNRLNRVLLEEIIENRANCEFAEDGREAIGIFEYAVLKKEFFDVVFLDIMMPFFNGHEVLNSIREIEKENKVTEPNVAKVVMISCLGDRENVTSAFSAGCDGYLIKPFSTQKVLQILET